MLLVECKGTPYEIGHQHGVAAKPQIDACIAFYASLFQKNCKLAWPEVLARASDFERTAKEKWPAYHEEMRGVADGSRRELLDIVAINVRTEINFGMFSDGCTALAWQTEKRAWLAQNWDWMSEQKANLILTRITQTGYPTILQVTEAGIIGKIGFNSSGVGTLLNAIKVPGVDPTRLPVHFGLRMALESNSVDEAVQKLEGYGMAASAHILLADPHKVTGLEFTKSTFAHCPVDDKGRLAHTNHLLGSHPGEVDTVWIKDSLTRLNTMRHNTESLSDEPGWAEINALFQDEENLPGAICRLETPESGSETLFNIVMDLKAKRGTVKLGRPTQVNETVVLEL
ncbi:peptidase C45 acyl-coenzyme A:6-aminopenicillanic acid acyl-transferas-like protein [Periconia macrospinosa]|uniref:Peptidase C45 acyl-coenzyme A:6-aminopenicillanic acid acyl-transferas-like protein n=1 Tax=Periconia macrospinosa TaxID=97972 RepID=A0A2V1DBA3_9PLEO|nr:peptidase C45 acyl-coenzyme A:6-aminopenicillanic acid acyl-transferas-like protein [Periconia macrospinosa]